MRVAELRRGDGRLTEGADGPVLISASRRTDIPRYFGRWFAERRRAGYAEFETAFRVKGRVSLAPRDVRGYVFWTRDARPFAEPLRALREEGAKWAVQFTINGYPRWLEPHVPSVGGAIESFLAVAHGLPGVDAIQWRYDPIVLAESMPASFHVSAFERLARELEGATHVVNVSIVEPYAKAIRRMGDATVRYRAPDPERHRAVVRRYPALPIAEEAAVLLRELAAIANERGMQLRACCNPEYGLPSSQCIGADLFAPYGLSLEGVRKAPTRSACRCLRSVDIGMADTCVAGCRYCYVTGSQQAAIASLRAHDPLQPALRTRT